MRKLIALILALTLTPVPAVAQTILLGGNAPNTTTEIALSATDNAVLDSIDTDLTTIIGHVDGLEALITTIDSVLDQSLLHYAEIETAVEILDNLVLAEDAAHVSGEPGVMILGVRNDAGTVLASDGERIPLSFDSQGRVRVVTDAVFEGEIALVDGDADPITDDPNDALRVSIVSGAASGTTDNDDGTIASGQSTLGLQLGLGYVYTGAAWARMVGDATNGVTVNLGTNNDVTVTGSVTANAGTNLNTSALLTTTNFTDVFGTATLLTSTQADNLANTTDTVNVSGLTYVFDGSTWDRWTGAVTVSGVATAANQTTEIGHVDGLETLIGTSNSSLASIVTAVQLTDNIVSVEDAVAGSGFSGVGMLAVRQSSQSNLAADGDFVAPTIDDSGGLRVSIVAGAGSGGTALADDADFTDGTTSGTPIGGVAESASPTTITEGDFGWVALTLNRAMKVTLYNSSGAELTTGSDYTHNAALTADSSAGPLGMFLAKDFDGSALPNVVSTEGDAVSGAASLYGVQYFMLTNEDGSLQYGTSTTPLQVQSNSANLATQTTLASVQTAVELIDNAISGAGFNITQFAGAAVPMTTTQADDLVNTLDGLNSTSFTYVFDGTGWDRAPGTAADGLLVNLGSNNDVTVTGDALTALQLIDNIVAVEDAASGAGGYSGVPFFAVRQSSQSNLAADGDFISPTIDDSGGLRVSIVAGAGSGGTALADDADFTDGTTQGTPIGGVAESASPTTVTEGDFGWAAITLNRALKVALYGANGTELALATAANQSTMITALQLIDNSIFADDAAFTLASSSVTMAGAIRDDSLSTLSAVEGDAVPLRVSSTGALHVTGGGGGTEYNVNDAAAANPTGSTFLMERDDALSSLTEVEGDWTNPRSNANGALWTAVDGTVTVSGTVTANLSATDNAVLDDIADGIAVTQSGTWNVATVSTVTTLSQLGGVALPVEDSGETANGVGIYAMSVRRDTPASSAGTTGDNATLNTNAVGALYVAPGGASVHYRTSAGSTEDEHEIKATAGILYSILITNTNAAARYIRCYNLTASNTTPGSSTVFWGAAIPGATTGAGFVYTFPSGMTFDTALTCTFTTGAADTDVAEVAANEIKATYTLR